MWLRLTCFVKKWSFCSKQEQRHWGSGTFNTALRYLEITRMHLAVWRLSMFLHVLTIPRRFLLWVVLWPRTCRWAQSRFWHFYFLTLFSKSEFTNYAYFTLFSFSELCSSFLRPSHRFSHPRGAEMSGKKPWESTRHHFLHCARRFSSLANAGSRAERISIPSGLFGGPFSEDFPFNEVWCGCKKMICDLNRTCFITTNCRSFEDWTLEEKGWNCKDQLKWVRSLCSTESCNS